MARDAVIASPATLLDPAPPLPSPPRAQLELARTARRDPRRRRPQRAELCAQEDADLCVLRRRHRRRPRPADRPAGGRRRGADQRHQPRRLWRRAARALPVVEVAAARGGGGVRDGCDPRRGERRSAGVEGLTRRSAARRGARRGTARSPSLSTPTTFTTAPTAAPPRPPWRRSPCSAWWRRRRRSSTPSCASSTPSATRASPTARAAGAKTRCSTSPSAPTPTARLTCRGGG